MTIQSPAAAKKPFCTQFALQRLKLIGSSANVYRIDSLLLLKITCTTLFTRQGPAVNGIFIQIKTPTAAGNLLKVMKKFSHLLPIPNFIGKFNSFLWHV